MRKGAQPLHSGGHEAPGKGGTLRAHLERGQDGGYEVLLPNGLVAVGRGEGVVPRP